MAARSFAKFDPCKTIMLLCDMQDKFRNAIPLFGNIIKNAGRLLQVGKALDIPLLVTEQYPKGLGHTVKEFDVSHALSVVPKTKFSMHLPEVMCHVDKIQPTDVVIIGVEAHVCVFQSAVDFLESDMNVHIVPDCCASRLNQDRDTAFNLMRQIGCFLQTSEMIMFGLLQDKDHPKFAGVRKILGELSTDMELTLFPPKKGGKSGGKKCAPKKSK